MMKNFTSKLEIQSFCYVTPVFKLVFCICFAKLFSPSLQAHPITRKLQLISYFFQELILRGCCSIRKSRDTKVLRNE